MIEVFKTNVNKMISGDRLLPEIQSLNQHYLVSFDLEDCDRILRIENPHGTVDGDGVIKTLARFGFYAEILSN